MRGWMEWLDAAGGEGDMIVVGVFMGMAYVLARLERR